MHNAGPVRGAATISVRCRSGLGSITNQIPRGPSTHVLILCLDQFALCLMIASLVAMMRLKRCCPIQASGSQSALLTAIAGSRCRGGPHGGDGEVVMIASLK
jgi:hypothetical protein